MNKIQVEILGLSSSPSAGGAYALLLKEVFGNRRLPIIIGTFEAHSISFELEGIKPPRPLTHDLLKSVIDSLRGTVQEVIISDLRDNTFIGSIIIDISGLTNEIDARPSDAIGLALRADAPIFVNEEVMKVASFVPSSEEVNDDKFPDSKMSDEFGEGIGGKTFTGKDAKIAALQDQLRDAIEKEDYERAANIRDQIKKFQGSSN